METITIIAILAFAILNLILFFKIWGMTNDVSRIADYVQRIANRTNADSKPKTTTSETATNSTANPTPSEEPNKDSDKGMDEGAKFAIIAIILVTLFILFIAYARNY